ncbi:MAG: hypothetical protein OXE94_04895 [Aestuariivita sp.]|nr:hypothetical protein [Aestuariivita sp.]MCY4202148.1 hypothetical protein [Aestuariivita sp.]MCY4289589.1 hypothetical protein [Aestuariivita sp.]MCY4347908.1 hypothetical protein [Aestuariivita sp.]
MESRIDTKLTALAGAIDKQQAEYRTDISHLAEKMAERDKDNQRWTIGFGIAQIAITIAAIGGGIAILTLLIGLPAN